MGYESKVYVALKHEMSGNWYETLAGMEMCKMGYNNGWIELFKTPIEPDSHWYGMDSEEAIHEDSYGEAPKYAPLKDVIAWLLSEKAKSDYRRLNCLYALLTSYDLPEYWGSNVIVIHYGH